jgi:hypothetical protein
MVDSVAFDDSGVVRTRANGERESVRWDDLQEVSIVTTDEGPFSDDVFWLLVGTAGGCAVPSESAGMGELLPRLQALPGFDNEAVIQAMGSVEHARFVCWRRTPAT